MYVKQINLFIKTRPCILVNDHHVH